MDPVYRLYPQPGASLPLHGLYLASDLRSLHGDAECPFVYTNFVTSLDGRIAVVNADTQEMGVPHAVANPRDWRLFQELAAQSDVMITSGSYFRHRASGNAQEITTFDDPRFADLRSWREERGLPARADLAIVSRSLRFTLPPEMASGGRRILVVTGANADEGRVAEIEARGGTVIIAGEDGVDGARMVAALGSLGYRIIYSVAGPAIAHILFSAGAVDRLYVTLAHRLLGGGEFATFVEGPRLDPPTDLQLAALYLDATAAEGTSQLFATYDVIRR